MSGRKSRKNTKKNKMKYVNKRNISKLIENENSNSIDNIMDEKIEKDMEKGKKKLNWNTILDDLYKIATIIAVLVTGQSVYISRQALKSSTQIAKRTEAFEEKQRFFQPLSGRLKKSKQKMNVYLPSGKGNWKSIKLNRLLFAPYQGGIASYSQIQMDNSNHLVIGNTMSRNDPNNIGKKVNEYSLSFGDMTLNRVAVLPLDYKNKQGIYNYFDTFILLTDYIGDKHLYLVSLLTYYPFDNEKTIYNIYYNFYDENVLLENNSSRISISDNSNDDPNYEVAVVHKPEYFKKQVEKGKETDVKDVYAFFLSNSIKRYQKVYNRIEKI